MKAWAAAIVLGSPAAMLAQDSAPSLGWMHGAWIGKGTLFGRPSSVTLSVEPALEASATTLVHTARVEPEGGRPANRFEGRAIYRLDPKGRVAGRWTDSAGNAHPVGGQVAASAMTTVWGEPATEIGRSTYRLEPDGSLAVTDAVLRPDGSWSVFARATYRRR